MGEVFLFDFDVFEEEVELAFSAGDEALEVGFEELVLGRGVVKDDLEGVVVVGDAGAFSKCDAEVFEVGAQGAAFFVYGRGV